MIQIQQMGADLIVQAVCLHAYFFSFLQPVFRPGGGLNQGQIRVWLQAVITKTESAVSVESLSLHSLKVHFTEILNFTNSTSVFAYLYLILLQKHKYLKTYLCLSGSRSQQLCVKLEPRGLLYVKLSLQEKWDTQVQHAITTDKTSKKNTS